MVVLREMKILVYLTLLCLGAKADSKKIVWMSNKGKGDMVIRCTSGVTVFNKFLKAEEKTRWKLPAKSRTGICHVDIKGKGGGYLSVSECKSECKWMIYDDGIAKLQLGSGAWKRIPLVSDEETARRWCDEFESPAPQRHMVENDLNEAPSQLPPKNWEHRHGLPSPLPHHVPKNREHTHLKSPPPRNREHIHVAPSPLKSPPPKNREHTNGAPSPLPEHVKNREHTYGAPSPSPEHVEIPPPKNREEPSRAPSRDVETPPPRADREEETHWAPPPWDGDVEAPPPWDGDESPPPKSEEETNGAPSPQPDKGELPPLPQPGSTFYTCIKEDTD